MNAVKTLIINCSPVRDGATAYFASLAAEELKGSGEVKAVCIDDFDFSFCLGCRSCHKTARCVTEDGVQQLVSLIGQADRLICISPSYWADVPGQFKAFIDRCTPWCNTHTPHASVGSGKKGLTIVLRTGPNMKECERLISTVEHFYGHMEIEPCGSLGLCGVEDRSDAEARADEVRDFLSSVTW